MSATELIDEISRLPQTEREQVFEFVLHAQKPDWMTPKPPGYFADCYSEVEIEESNWFTARSKNQHRRQNADINEIPSRKST